MTCVDYPAAHSADTEWFAVDRDGNVAVFDTGEAGAVPVGAYEEGNLGLLQELPPRGDVLRVPPVPPWPLEEVHQVSGRIAQAAVFHLRDASALAAEIEAGKARRVPSAGSQAVLVEQVDPGIVERAHAQENCLGCSHEYEEPPAGVIGVFRYTHLWDAGAGPYRQTQQPTVPLRVADLPEETRTKVVSFEGHFAETPLLQPVQHWPCESWGAAWIDLDGKTVRPIPGQEAGYDEHAANLADMGLVFDPPPRPLQPPAPKDRGAARAPAVPRGPWWKFW